MAEHKVCFTHLDEPECWSLAAYMALSLLMIDDETRATLRERLRPGLDRVVAIAGGGHA